MAMGRNGEGRAARAGGWGLRFRDEAAHSIWPPGGAGGVARWGMVSRNVAARDADRGDRLGLCQPDAHRFYTPEWERSRVAALAPLVTGRRAKPMPVAMHVVNQAAQNWRSSRRAVRGPTLEAGGGRSRWRTRAACSKAACCSNVRILVEMEAREQACGATAPAALRAVRGVSKQRGWAWSCGEGEVDQRFLCSHEFPISLTARLAWMVCLGVAGGSLSCPSAAAASGLAYDSGGFAEDVSSELPEIAGPGF